MACVKAATSPRSIGLRPRGARGGKGRLSERPRREDPPMRAMILERPGEPLRLVELPTPVPGDGQVRVKVAACGVCRTDLHVVDGDLKEPKLPIIPGHEIVGYVDAVGSGVTRLSRGDRVGIPWLGHTCGA